MSDTVSYFEEHVPHDVQKKAYDNLAYELLDSYLSQVSEEEGEQRLMETLQNEIQPYLSQWYTNYKESKEITK